MNKAQKENLIKCPAGFVERVSKGDTFSETETQVLPGVARVLLTSGL